jgi:predicted RNA binding protein YcfA (HicA-like mRNA interferase family)
VKRSQLVKRLHALGWTSLRRGKGSHEIFVHPAGARPIPVPTHGSDIPEPLARMILTQALRNVKHRGSD